MLIWKQKKSANINCWTPVLVGQYLTKLEHEHQFRPENIRCPLFQTLRWTPVLVGQYPTKLEHEHQFRPENVRCPLFQTLH